MSSNENKLDRTPAIGQPKKLYSHEEIVKILEKLVDAGYDVDELTELTIEEADNLSKGITN